MNSTPSPPEATPEELASYLEAEADALQQYAYEFSGGKPSRRADARIKQFRQAATLLRTLSAVTRERDEARRMLDAEKALRKNFSFCGDDGDGCEICAALAAFDEALSRHRQRQEPAPDTE